MLVVCCVWLPFNHLIALPCSFFLFSFFFLCFLNCICIDPQFSHLNPSNSVPHPAGEEWVIHWMGFTCQLLLPAIPNNTVSRVFFFFFFPSKPEKNTSPNSQRVPYVFSTAFRAAMACLDKAMLDQMHDHI